MTTDRPRLSTGVGGLDRVLEGGLPAGRSYMVTGGAGAGKTILGQQFLTADPDADTLYVAFEEGEADIRDNAATLGIDLSGVRILDFSPDASLFLEGGGYSVFEPDEVEGEDVFGRIAAELQDDVPDRLFVDPLSRLRQLAADDHQFRRRIASMTGYLRTAGCTTVFTAQPTGSDAHADLEYLADGAIELVRRDQTRTVEVTKLRGSGFRSGTHAVRIDGRGLSVYPRLVPGEHARAAEHGRHTSGVDRLDQLLGGGLERGTVTVISGPSGVGKSTTAAHFLAEAAREGDGATAYLFEESASSLTRRSDSIGLGLSGLVEAGDLRLETVEPLALSADEFASRVRADVERGVELVVIDGVAGYRLSLHHDHAELITQLHALCRYLRNVGVSVVLTEEVRSVTGDFVATDEQISYIADNIVFLRYLEIEGEIRKSIGVLKKRLGRFESTLRGLEITDEGFVVGEPLDRLRGVLTGTPEWADGGDEDD
jgi:circadian clock protein KaiC